MRRSIGEGRAKVVACLSETHRRRCTKKRVLSRSLCSLHLSVVGLCAYGKGKTVHATRSRRMTINNRCSFGDPQSITTTTYQQAPHTGGVGGDGDASGLQLPPLVHKTMKRIACVPSIGLARQSWPFLCAEGD